MTSRLQFAALFFAVAAAAAGQVVPTPPTPPSAGYGIQAELGLPNTTGYTAVTVPDSGNSASNSANLQAAINAASCNPVGTVIFLPAGVVYDGGITLPAKTCAAGQWVVIRSGAAASALPAAGARTSPSFAPMLPVIETDAVNVDGILVAPAAENYWLSNLEITIDTAALSGKDSTAALVDIGNGTYGAGCFVCSPGEEPSNIVLDRMLLRGSDAPPIGLRRGVAMNCARCAVVNSWIDQIHEVGADTQAIGGWDSTGPWLVDNNYLSAAAENVLVGGADSNMGQNESDLTFTRNYFFKPLSWNPGDAGYAGTNWSVKNLLEFKSGVRVLVEGNVFQNDWLAAQSGRAIVINPTDAGDANNPWVTTSDIAVEYNRIDNTQGFAEVAMAVPGGSSVAATRIALTNNLATNQGVGSGYLFLGVSDATANVTGLATEVLVSHNTTLLSLSAPQVPSSGYEFESEVNGGQAPLVDWAMHNNIWEVGQFQVHGNCSVAGAGSNCFTADAWWDDLPYDTAGLCSAGGQSTIYATHAPACPIADVNAIGFVNGTGGDYALQASSPGHMAATDGTDVGADIAGLNSQIAGVAPPTQAATRRAGRTVF